MTHTPFDNPRLARGVVWLGAGGFFVLGVAGMLLARIIPSYAPTDSGEQIAARFMDHQTSIRVGLALAFVAFACWGVWAAALVAMTRPMEGSFPVITYVSMLLAAVACTFFVYPVFFWAAIAFRPAEMSPDLIRALNDVAWFAFLWVGPFFAVWWILLAIAILRSSTAVQVFPRWAGWACLCEATAISPSAGIIFFKEGAFSWNGAISFWLVLVTYFLWMCAMTYCMLRAISTGALGRRETTQHGQPSLDEVLAPAPSPAWH